MIVKAVTAEHGLQNRYDVFVILEPREARYTKSGARMDANSASQRGAPTVAGRNHAPPEADGWLEASWYNDKAPFGGISANPVTVVVRWGAS